MQCVRGTLNFTHSIATSPVTKTKDFTTSLGTFTTRRPVGLVRIPFRYIEDPVWLVRGLPETAPHKGFAGHAEGLLAESLIVMSNKHGSHRSGNGSCRSKGQGCFTSMG